VGTRAVAIAAYNPHRPRPRSLEGLRKNVRHGGDGRWRWHWDPAFLSGDLDEARLSRNAAWLSAALRQLRVPTLLVRGGTSDVLSAAGAADFVELVPHAEVVTIAGAG